MDHSATASSEHSRHYSVIAVRSNYQHLIHSPWVKSTTWAALLTYYIQVLYYAVILFPTRWCNLASPNTKYEKCGVLSGTTYKRFNVAQCYFQKQLRLPIKNEKVMCRAKKLQSILQKVNVVRIQISRKFINIVAILFNMLCQVALGPSQWLCSTVLSLSRLFFVVIKFDDPIWGFLLESPIRS